MNSKKLTAAQQPAQEGGGEVFGWWMTDCSGVGRFVYGADPVCRQHYETTPGYSARPLYTAPPSAPVGVEAVPPEAKKVEGTALGAGFVHKDDWAIPSGSCSVRIVDQRMAYGWNQCREEMLERIAQQPAQAAPEYTQAMGEAAHRYIDSKCRMSDGSYAVSPPSFPGGFLWSELYNAMLAAAPTPPGDDAAGGVPLDAAGSAEGVGGG